MRFSEVRNITQLRKYFNKSKTSLTIKNIDNYEIIYSYSTPIAYIYNEELYVLYDRYFSPTTQNYIHTLKILATDYITTKQLYTLCRNLGIETGRL